MTTIQCKICGGEAASALSVKVLFKHRAHFFHCAECGFLQTPDPYWLKEAYTDAIITADTGLVQRNLTLSHVTGLLLYVLFPRGGRFLDIAAGYGLFVRMMRDVGFDFYWSDKYCQNLFAKGFESNYGEGYDVVSAFEVLEHVSDPLRFISDAFDTYRCDSIIFTTVLFAGDPPHPESWWYYAFEGGQHISFYERRTLEVIAQHLGMHLYSNQSVHMFSRRKVSRAAFAFLTTSGVARALSFIPRLGMKSRTFSDHLRLIKRQ